MKTKETAYSIKTFFGLALIALSFASCKKESTPSIQTGSNVLKSMTSMTYGDKQSFQYSNGLLNNYTIIWNGIGTFSHQITYNQGQPTKVVSGTGDKTTFSYLGNQIVVVTDDGNPFDSLIYTLSCDDKIESVLAFNSSGDKQLKEYQYSYGNLVKLSVTDYATNGSPTSTYGIDASYDNANNPLTVSNASLRVLYEYLFRYNYGGEFTVNSSNNPVSIVSNEPSMEVTYSIQFTYNSSNYPIQENYSLTRFGFTDTDSVIWEYH